jgi:hypothetical protein
MAILDGFISSANTAEIKVLSDGPAAFTSSSMKFG